MPNTNIRSLKSVGDSTIAIEVETPSGFKAFPGQFVLVRATINDEEKTGYYTISSPNVEERFELTVAVDPDGTLGPWLANRTLNETISVEGPYGDIQYVADSDALVFARGPGIGPAVGIAERARNAGRDATIVYGGNRPPHKRRLNDLESNGAQVILTDDLTATIAGLDLSISNSYVFGFQEFVEDVKTALSTNEVDQTIVEIESYGPA